MRYELDHILKAEFRKALTRLISHFPASDGGTGDELAEMCKRYYEMGYDDGCRSCGVYSEHLKDLYAPVDLTGYE